MPNLPSGLPFTRTLVEAVDSSMEIHSVHRLGNPMKDRSWRRNSQDTESNAFAMSTLMDRRAVAAV
jgi:hypothetical protein